jgi:guanyl-specific ribonuclease Sa
MLAAGDSSVAAGQEAAQAVAASATAVAVNADVYRVVMAPGGEWTAAAFLKPGDQLRAVDPASLATRTLIVTANELDPTPTRVYTLTVADSHTYAVGELGAWVHNARTYTVGETLKRIANGIKDPHRNDGTNFQNRPRKDGTIPLPCQAAGYYTEYVVGTRNIPHAGARRLVVGLGGDVWYTMNHYKIFTRLK